MHTPKTKNHGPHHSSTRRGRFETCPYQQRRYRAYSRCLQPSLNPSNPGSDNNTPFAFAPICHSERSEESPLSGAVHNHIIPA